MKVEKSIVSLRDFCYDNIKIKIFLIATNRRRTFSNWNTKYLSKTKSVLPTSNETERGRE